LKVDDNALILTDAGLVSRGASGFSCPEKDLRSCVHWTHAHRKLAKIN
jgi:hypothetical protein